MRVGQRTTLAMLLVACVPLAFAGWTAIRLSERALISRAEQANTVAAQVLAARIADTSEDRLHAIELAGAAIDLSQLVPAERIWAMRLVFRQVKDSSAVALFDQNGEQAAEPVFLTETPKDAAIRDRSLLGPGDVDRFASNIPFELARDLGRAIGPVYVAGDGGTRMVVAVACQGGFVLAVELSLRSINALLDEHGVGERARVFVVDEDGHVILAQDSLAVASREDRSDWSIVKRVLDGGEYVGGFEHPELGEALGAATQVTGLGWAVVIAEPRDDALAGIRSVAARMMAAFGVALILAIGLGLALSRAIARPIRALHRGTRAIEKGEFEHRVSEDNRQDEIGDLARAFNTMAGEVQSWRNVLEGKIEERTRELRESQELLIRAQKMAAVGQLGASVSHQINNPLFAVLGTTELLLADAESGTETHQDLQQIHEEALRIKAIVGELLQLADSSVSEHQQEISVVQALEQGLLQTREQLETDGVVVEKDFSPDLPQVLGDPDALSEAFRNIIDNARRAGASIVKIAVSGDDTQLVRIRFEDNGTGIEEAHQHRIFDPFYTTWLQASSAGLGLSRVNQIVENHHGSIVVDSVPGQGATFTIMLPTVQKRSFI